MTIYINYIFKQFYIIFSNVINKKQIKNKKMLQNYVFNNPTTLNNSSNLISKLALLKNSFYFTYVLLLTTGTITFIEALRTPSPQVRHIMNLETCISLIAGYFYSVFNQEVKESEEKMLPLDYTKINRIRYVDWSISTPLMLLVLTLFLSNNSGVPVKLLTYALIVILDLSMLGFGYAGETGLMKRKLAWLLSFGCFFVMFALIAYTFLPNKLNLPSVVVFGLFFVVWSIYGMVYNLDDEKKNTVFNVLDAIAKCVVGITLWAYFTKILVL
jgi:bacteriorhodopsin